MTTGKKAVAVLLGLVSSSVVMGGALEVGKGRMRHHGRAATNDVEDGLRLPLGGHQPTSHRIIGRKRPRHRSFLRAALRGGAASDEVDDQKLRKQTLNALHLTSFLAVASTSMVIFTPLPSLTSHLSSSPNPQAQAVKILSILSSVSAAVELFLSPSVGALIDSKGRKATAVMLNALIMAANFGAVLHPGVWSVCLSRMVNVLAGGFLVIIGNVVIADTFSTNVKTADTNNNSDAMGSVLGKQAACVSLGFLLGSMTGGRLTERGERAAYGGALALSTLATMNVLFRMRDSLDFVRDSKAAAKSEPSDDELTGKLLEAPLSSLRLLFAYGSQMRVLALLLLLQSAPAYMGDTFQVFAKEEWGFLPRDFANLVALFGIFGIVSNVSLPPVVRALGLRNFSLFAIVSALLFPVATLFFDSFRPLLVAGCLGLYGGTQKVGTSTAMISLATEQGVPQGQLQGEKASMLAALKIVSPLVYSTLYLKGKGWGSNGSDRSTAKGLDLLMSIIGSKLPFVLNIMLGICAFAVTWQNL